MAKRKTKTIAVDALRETINKRLALKTINILERRALADLLETVLMDTGNYHGFNWIYWLEQGSAKWFQDYPNDDGEWQVKTRYIYGNTEGVDDYRRLYY